MNHKWAITPLTKAHKRSGFDCGEPDLNDYLVRYARQNARLGVSKTYVLTEPGDSSVIGYYTVSAGSIDFASLPENDRKRLPQYPVPTAHLARLAVDLRFQKKGLGEVLLFNCLKRICFVAQEMGIYVVTVTALHNKAKGFYLPYGFVELLDDPMHLYMLVATASATIPATSSPSASSPPSSQ